MNKKAFAPVAFVIFFALAGASSPPAPVIKLILDQALHAATLQQGTQRRVAFLDGVATVLINRLQGGNQLGKRGENALNGIAAAGAELPQSLLSLNEEISGMRLALLRQKFLGMDSAFTSWDNAFDTALADARSFQLKAAPLQTIYGGRPWQLQQVLQETRDALNLLNADLETMQQRFQEIVRMLATLQRTGFENFPARRRILGETFAQHCRRTGHCGIISPKNPGRFFDSHAIEAVSDKDPKHTVWACEATIQDYLTGTVKGTEHPYAGSAKVSYCLRCHAARSGASNNRWCDVEFKDDFEKDVSALEKATQR